MKVDFLSITLRLALVTQLGLGFLVASEKGFFPWLTAAFFRFRVGLLLLIGSVVGVENSAHEVSRMSMELF